MLGLQCFVDLQHVECWRPFPVTHLGVLNLGFSLYCLVDAYSSPTPKRGRIVIAINSWKSILQA